MRPAHPTDGGKKWPPDQATIRRGVVVVGSTTIDCNVIDRDTYFKIGGVTTYAGLTYRRHGLPTSVVTNVAPSDALILRRLTREGIQVSSGPTELTTRFVNHVHTGRRRQETSSVASKVDFGQLAALRRRFGFIHLGPLHPGDIDSKVFVRIGETRSIIALDVQGLLRKIVAGRMEADVSEHLSTALAAACIVKSDEDELRLVLNAFGARMEDLMHRFVIAEWVMTSGPHGGCIHRAGRSPCRYSAEPSSPVIDPTGAGDVFFAAYAVARLRDRKPVGEAARYAAGLASQHVAGRYLPDLLLVPRLPAEEGGDFGFNCVDNGQDKG
jgi:sugar/nucleoside kinase (ribokinase family)